MDPLSITVGTLSILKTSTWVASELRQVINGAKLAEPSINGLLLDLDSFTQTLQLLKDTAESPRIRDSIGVTGYIGAHWENLRNSFDGAENTVKGLQNLVQRVNKTVRVLDSVRKDRRLQSAEREIALYRQRITNYKQVFDTSLQAAIAYQQVSLHEAGEKTAVSLDRVESMIIDQNSSLGSIIETLKQMKGSSSASPNPNVDIQELESELQDMTNLQKCLKSAGSVVSSASITLEQRLGGSITRGSILDDAFPPNSDEQVRNYLENIDEAESDKLARSSLTGSSQRTLAVLDVELDSDDEEDLERNEYLIRLGRSRVSANDYTGAEKYFSECVNRLDERDKVLGSSPARQSLKRDASLELAKVVLGLGKWPEAEQVLKEQISLHSGNNGIQKDQLDHLNAILQLSEVLMKQNKPLEALIYAKKALRPFRKQSNPSACKRCLEVLIPACNATGNNMDADIYSAMLLKMENPDQYSDQRTEPAVSSGSGLRTIRGSNNPFRAQLPSPPIDYRRTTDPVNIIPFREKEGVQISMRSLKNEDDFGPPPYEGVVPNMKPNSVYFDPGYENNANLHPQTSKDGAPQQAIEMLTAMGFTASQACQALKETDGKMGAAVDLLLGHHHATEHPHAESPIPKKPARLPNQVPISQPHIPESTKHFFAPPGSKKKSNPQKNKRIDSEQHRRAFKDGRSLMWDGNFTEAERILLAEKRFWDSVRRPSDSASNPVARSLMLLNDLRGGIHCRRSTRPARSRVANAGQGQRPGPVNYSTYQGPPAPFDASYVAPPPNGFYQNAPSTYFNDKPPKRHWWQKLGR